MTLQNCDLYVLTWICAGLPLFRRGLWEHRQQAHRQTLARALGYRSKIVRARTWSRELSRTSQASSCLPQPAFLHAAPNRPWEGEDLVVMAPALSLPTDVQRWGAKEAGTCPQRAHTRRSRTLPERSPGSRGLGSVASVAGMRAS